MFYDVWANIHYGYVGRAIGMSEWELFWGQRAAAVVLGGVNDAADDLSVKLGMWLWRDFGGHIT